MNAACTTQDVSRYMYSYGLGYSAVVCVVRGREVEHVGCYYYYYYYY